MGAQVEEEEIYYLSLLLTLLILPSCTYAATQRYDINTATGTATLVPTCGDSLCNGTETNASCSGDCPSSPPPPPPSGTPKLLTLGNSLTRGVGDVPDETAFGYRDHLQAALGLSAYQYVGGRSYPASHATYSVKTSGRGGWAAADLLNVAYCDYGGSSDYTQAQCAGKHTLQLDLEVQMANAPSGSKVVLMFGTVEMAGTTVTPAQASDDTMAVVNYIHAFNPNIAVYVGIPPPSRNATTDARLVTYKSELESDVAASSKANLYTFDTRTPILAVSTWQTTLFTNDEHPNDAGYQIIKTAIQNAISP